MATSITFSPDEKRVASTSLDWEVRIWDLDTGLCIQTLDGCNSVSFSPDGKHVAAVSEGNIICIWDCYTIQELRNKTRERFKNRQLTSKERRKYYLE